MEWRSRRKQFLVRNVNKEKTFTSGNSVFDLNGGRHRNKLRLSYWTFSIFYIFGRSRMFTFLDVYSKLILKKIDENCEKNALEN